MNAVDTNAFVYYFDPTEPAKQAKAEALSMILGACREAGVTTLYTEDMGAPTSYDGVQLVNPFV